MMKTFVSLPAFRGKFFGRTPRARLPGMDLKKITGQLSRNWQKLALLGLFGLGLFLGAKTAGGAPGGWLEHLTGLLRAQKLSRATHSVLANALSYFGTELLFALAAYLLGLCAAGLPLLLLLPVLKGVGVGVVSGWLYMTSGVMGIGYSVLVLYPSAVLSALVLVSCCKESMFMAGDMTLLLGGKLDRTETSLRLYTTRYMMLLLVSVLAAALDALCYLLFSDLFSLAS